MTDLISIVSNYILAGNTTGAKLIYYLRSHDYTLIINTPTGITGVDLTYFDTETCKSYKYRHDMKMFHQVREELKRIGITCHLISERKLNHKTIQTICKHW